MDYKLSYPAVNGEVVTEGHANYCKENGHATYTMNGVASAICPRCGSTKEVATSKIKITKAQVIALNKLADGAGSNHMRRSTNAALHNMGFMAQGKITTAGLAAIGR